MAASILLRPMFVNALENTKPDTNHGARTCATSSIDRYRHHLVYTAHDSREAHAEPRRDREDAYFWRLSYELTWLALIRLLFKNRHQED